MNWLSNIFGAIKEYFGWATQRSEVSNAPDVRAAKIGSQDEQTKSKIEQDVAKGSVDDLRKDVS